jgi:hypothetical protein
MERLPDVISISDAGIQSFHSREYNFHPRYNPIMSGAAR